MASHPTSAMRRTTFPAAPKHTRPGIAPIQRQTIASMAVEALRERILRGDYPDGEPLRQDALADELGVSRIPVREALRQLEAEGLVTFSPHRGAVVSSLSLAEIEELFELRAEIECDLLRRAIPKTTKEQLDRATRSLDEFEDALQRGRGDALGTAQLALPRGAVRAGESQLHDGRAAEAASAQRPVFPHARAARARRREGERRASRDRRGRRDEGRERGEPADARAHPRRGAVAASRCSKEQRGSQARGSDRARDDALRRAFATSSPATGATSESDAWIADINPSNGDDVDRPRAARHERRCRRRGGAQPPRRSTAGDRRPDRRAPSCFTKWAAAIGARSEEIAQLVAREVGKPIGEARGEVGRCVTILRYYAGEAVRATGDVIPAQAAGALQFSRASAARRRRADHAVEFSIGDSALEGGAGVGVRQHGCPQSRPNRRRSARSRWPRCAAAAGLPRRCLQRGVRGRATASVGTSRIVAGRPRGELYRLGPNRRGRRQAAAATKHPVPNGDGRKERRDRHAGRGSAPGRDRSRRAGRCATRARSARRRAASSWRAKWRRRFFDELRSQVAALPIGPVTDAAAAVGPVISAQSRASIEQALDGIDAERVYVGEMSRRCMTSRAASSSPPTDHSRSARPILLSLNASCSGRCWRRSSADDLEHAIALANDTPYGLSASLFTRDLRSALRYIDRIEAGMVRVNGDTTGVDPHAPFGGMKGSSSGTREQGTAARDFYTEIKTVQINP